MFPRLRHVFQCGRAWWQYYEAHAEELRDVVVETMVKLFACGTSSMGYTVWRCSCEGCDHTKRICFSCKSRSCSSCGKKATEQWVQQQLQVLPVTPWQHMTFTMPCQYWELVAENRWLLSAFSKLAAEVILEYCARRGIQPGIFNAIHTWGRDMKWHPHIHLSTTAGGLTADGKRWKSLEFHHRTLMKQWRYKVTDFLRKNYWQLVMPSSLTQESSSRREWEKFLNRHYQRKWNIHVAPPTEDAHHTISYFGRYLKRPPVSLSRLDHYGGGDVTLTYNSHKTKRLERLKMSLDTFIEKFIQHIPDKHFRMIRYYGFLSHAKRGELLEKVHTLVGHEVENRPKITFAMMFKRFTGERPLNCLLCGARLLLCGLKEGLKLKKLLGYHKSLALMGGV